MLNSSIDEKDSFFFETRRTKDKDRIKVLEQSHKIYSGGEICSVNSSCVKICNRIFSLDLDREDCEQLPAPQVYQFEKLYDYILEKDLFSLQKINIFDFKMFLNFSPEPLYHSLRTLGPFFSKQFLIWIASDWKAVKVLSEEDWDFLFLEIFLNEGGLFPISPLKEKLSEGQSFAELAWLKQNDSAFLWLDDYFHKVQCLELKEKEVNHCVLAQYCLLSEDFQSDVLKEFVDFKRLKVILDQTSEWPQVDFKGFCSAFCFSEKGQNYCN